MEESSWILNCHGWKSDKLNLNLYWLSNFNTGPQKDIGMKIDGESEGD